MKSESVWSSLTAHGKGRKMISGRKMIGFLQSHKTAIILMFLFILLSTSVSSAALPLQYTRVSTRPNLRKAPLTVNFTDYSD